MPNFTQSLYLINPQFMNEEQVLDAPNVKRKIRKDLLPKWIKFFSWLFLILGCVTPFIFLNALNPNPTVHLALYGMSTTDLYSPVSVIITSIFLSKGIVAFGLLKSKKWGADFAIADGVIGIVICILSFTIFPGIFKMGPEKLIPIEIIPLGIYAYKMFTIRAEWKNFATA